MVPVCVTTRLPALLRTVAGPATGTAPLKPWMLPDSWVSTSSIGKYTAVASGKVMSITCVEGPAVVSSSSREGTLYWDASPLPTGVNDLYLGADPVADAHEALTLLAG